MRPLVVGAVAILAVGAIVAAFLYSSDSAPAAESRSVAPASPAKAAANEPAPAEAAGALPDSPTPLRPAEVSPSGAGAGEVEARESAKAAGAAAPEEKPSEGTVTGLVVDHDGKPAPGVKVRMLGKESAAAFFAPSVDTDAAGRFSLNVPVKKKKTLRLRANRKDRMPIVVRDVAVRRDQTTDVGVIQFEASGALEVKVTSGDRPVPNIQVEIDLPKAKDIEKQLASNGKKAMDPEALEAVAEMARGRRTTNEEGVAHFPALPVGTVEVKVDVPHRAPPRATPSDPAFVTGDITRTVDVTLGKTETVEVSIRGLGVLSGRAFVRRAPLANEWLGLSEAKTSGTFLRKFGAHVRTRTDAEGKFTFPPVTPGDFVVSRGDPGEPFDFGSMAGMADDPMEASMKAAEKMFGGQKSGELDHTRPVEVTEGTSTVEVDFGGALLEAIVQNADDGSPLADATVRLFDPPKESDKKARRNRRGVPFQLESDGDRRPVRLRGRTDSRGRVTFQDLEPGAYRLVARVADRPPSAPVDLSLGVDGTARAVLPVPRSVTVRGTINDRAGNPIESATVSALPKHDDEPPYPDDFMFMMGAPRPRARSDAKGAFSLGEIASGAQKIVAYGEGFAPSLMDVNAPSEGWNFFLDKYGKVRVTVRRGGVPAPNVRVQVKLDAEDAPVPPEVWSDFGMLMTLGMAGSSVFGTNTGDDGVALLTTVPPGEWTISVVGISEPHAASAPDAPAAPAEDGGSSVTTSVGPAAGGVRVSVEALEKRAMTPPRKPIERRVRVVADQEAALAIDLPD